MSRVRHFLGVVLGGLWVGAVVFSDQLAGGHVEKFEVPERDADGNLVWMIRGERGWFLNDGRLQVERLRAEFYSSNRVEYIFTSDSALLDQHNRHARMASPIRLEGPGLIVVGNGAEWWGSSNLFHIEGQVRVVLSGDSGER